MIGLTVFQKPWKQADTGGRFSGGCESIMHKGWKKNLNRPENLLIDIVIIYKHHRSR